jgi:hypothetical protein
MTQPGQTYNIVTEFDISGLGVSENRVLMRIFGTKREEVAGGWRRLRNEEPLNSRASPNRRRKLTCLHIQRKPNYHLLNKNIITPQNFKSSFRVLLCDQTNILLKSM